MLAEVHIELQEYSGEPAKVEKPKKAKAKKGEKGKKGKKGKRLVAQIDPSVKAKIEAFASVTGKSYDDAAAHLVMAGVIG